MVVQRHKCVFGVPKINFLGHHVTITGIKALPERVSAVHEFPVPNTKKGSQMFIRILLYHRFKPGLASHLHPLHKACKGRSQVITWSDDCQIALDMAKSALASTALLEHPIKGCKTAMTVDASDFAVGGSLDQFCKRFCHPLSFFSKKLTTAEKKYAISNRELSHYISTSHIKLFHHYIKGKSFTAFTDNKTPCWGSDKCCQLLPSPNKASLSWQSLLTMCNMCQL